MSDDNTNTIIADSIYFHFFELPFDLERIQNNCKENIFEHPVPVPVLTPPGLVALIGLLMIIAVRRVKKGG